MESPRGGREEAAGLGQAGAVGGERKGQEITPGSGGPGKGKMLRCKQCAVNVETPRAAATAGPAHPALRPSCLLLLPTAGLQTLTPSTPTPLHKHWGLPQPQPHVPKPPPAPVPRGGGMLPETPGCWQAGEGREGSYLRAFRIPPPPAPSPSCPAQIAPECWAVGAGPCPLATTEQGHSPSGAGSCLHPNHPELCASSRHFTPGGLTHGLPPALRGCSHPPTSRSAPA